jgi:predicted chitinase
MRITADQIYKIAPGASSDIVNGVIQAQYLFDTYGVDTPKRLGAFFGNAAVETWGFTRLDENLYYTKPETIRKTWPTRFASDADVAPYVRNPAKLANKVYNGRMGNREGSDDGWDRRGSGILQTTGMDNFRAVQDVTGINCVANPELLRSMPWALEAALVYWKTHRLNRFADAGDLTGLTKAIQGGTGGLAQRETYTARAISAFSMPTFPLLRIGSRGADVSRLQEHLHTLGYYGDVFDGKFYDGTARAVMDFQAAHNLLVDGVCGRDTWAAILKEVGK